MNYTTARDYFFRFQCRAAQNTYVQRTKCNVSTFITLIEDTPQKLFPKKSSSYNVSKIPGWSKAKTLL